MIDHPPAAGRDEDERTRTPDLPGPLRALLLADEARFVPRMPGLRRLPGGRLDFDWIRANRHDVREILQIYILKVEVGRIEGVDPFAAQKAAEYERLCGLSQGFIRGLTDTTVRDCAAAMGRELIASMDRDGGRDGRLHGEAVPG